MIVGERVKWRHLKEDGSNEPANPLQGVVCALARAGAPATWSVLVLLDDGSFRTVDADNLVLTSSPGEVDELEAGREAINAIEYLDKYLNENFAETDRGGGPVEWATSLLGELKAELITIGTQRDEVTATAEKLAKDLKAAKAKPAKTDKPTETPT